jgi:hypothetical protein
MSRGEDGKIGRFMIIGYVYKFSIIFRRFKCEWFIIVLEVCRDVGKGKLEKKED